MDSPKRNDNISLLQDLEELDNDYDQDIKRQMDAKEFKDFKQMSETRDSGTLSDKKKSYLFWSVISIITINGLCYPRLLRFGKRYLGFKGIWPAHFFAICPTMIINGTIIGTFQGLLMVDFIEEKMVTLN